MKTHHKLTTVNFVRGDTGVARDVIEDRLAGLSEGESVAWKRYSMLPGPGEIKVTRRGERFEVEGETRI